MRRRHRLGRAGAWALGLLLALPLPLAADGNSEDDIEYGAYLAQECRSCHLLHEKPAGIPAIAGLPTDYFISALNAYKEGKRDHSTMRTIARSLDDDQIEALAAYYATK